MLHRPREKLFERDAVRSDQEGAGGVERRGEGVEIGAAVAVLAALHLDCGERTAPPDDEVHFPVAVSPIEQLAFAGCRGIRQMSPYGRFDQPAPVFSVGLRLLGRKAGRREIVVSISESST